MYETLVKGKHYGLVDSMLVFVTVCLDSSLSHRLPEGNACFSCLLNYDLSCSPVNINSTAYDFVSPEC